MNTPIKVNEKPASPASLWLPYVFDIVAPFGAYALVRTFGLGAIWALTVGGIIAGLSTAVNTIRRKGLDAIGGLVVLEMALSLVLLAFIRDGRLMLIRPSFYTGLAAIYLVRSAFAAGQPLTYIGSRPMAAQGGPARLAAYERAWELSPEFRRTHRGMTLGFGLALALDSILRVVIVYTFPVDRAAWLSSIPHVTAIVLMVACSALAGRRFKRLVDQQM
jgi:hypothetical protein